MKNKLLAYMILPVLGLAMLGIGTASAHGFGFGSGGFFNKNVTPEELAADQQEMFAEQAALLGLNVDVIKQGWADGKTLKEIAAENGISGTDLAAKMQAAARVRMAEHLKVLVDKGVITQAQADARLQFMQEHMGKGMGKMMGEEPGHMGRGHMDVDDD